jgi:hypothetical protein
MSEKKTFLEWVKAGDRSKITNEKIRLLQKELGQIEFYISKTAYPTVHNLEFRDRIKNQLEKLLK